MHRIVEKGYEEPQDETTFLVNEKDALNDIRMKDKNGRQKRELLQAWRFEKVCLQTRTQREFEDSKMKET